jgi:hypothetical protein
VSDHIVFDSHIDCPGNYSVLDELILAVVRPEADDASCPALCHAGHLHQFIQARVIDIDAFSWRWRRKVGILRSLR